MKHRALLGVAAAAMCATSASAQYVIEVIAWNLDEPQGIDVLQRGSRHHAYFGENDALRRAIAGVGVTAPVRRGVCNAAGVAVNVVGDVFWTCTDEGAIYKFDAFTGNVSMLLGGLDQPKGIDLDRFGNVYFTEASKVSVYDGVTTTQIADGCAFSDVAVTEDGRVYWSCLDQGTVSFVGEVGEAPQQLLTGLNSPVGLAINRVGTRLAVLEAPTPGASAAMSGANFVWEINLNNGHRSIVLYGETEPYDAAYGRDDCLYWTDRAEGVIYRACPPQPVEQVYNPEEPWWQRICNLPEPHWWPRWLSWPPFWCHD